MWGTSGWQPTATFAWRPAAVWQEQELSLLTTHGQFEVSHSGSKRNETLYPLITPVGSEVTDGVLSERCVFLNVGYNSDFSRFFFRETGSAGEPDGKLHPGGPSVNSDHDATRTQEPNPPTGTFDPALDAGLAIAFGADPTPGGWSQPPLLRDDSSTHSPVVQPTSTEMPRGNTERYQLLGEIARGGMGVILKGRDPDLGRDLAFKVLKAELAGKPAAVQRFVEEAQVGGQLQHPGVVPVYDLGRFADGRPYFAMKLVKGQTLTERLAERSTPAADRGKYLQIFLQVCQTVAYAHAKGVIHRDLKPSNIMVGAFGEVLVMDWGLAKVLPRGGVADEERTSRMSGDYRRPEEDPTVIHTARSGSGSDTAAGSVMGTPAFMPPEQAGGETEKLDERADVFGLGAVLCVVLTGLPPYLAETAEATRLMAIRGQQAEAFGRLDACGADAELLALCKQCLSPDRDARPRHAGEVAGAVGSYLAGVEQRAHRAEMDRAAAEARAAEEANTRREAEAKTAEERKRRRTQLALAASVALLLFGVGAFAWWQDKQATARRVETVNREQEERDRKERNAEAVAGLLDQCEVALKSDDVAKAAVTLEAAEKRAAEGGVDAHASRLARCRADLDMLRELDRIDDLRWTVKEGRERESQDVSKEWPVAFERFGIVPGTTPLDEAVRRISESLVRERLLSGLDRWLIVSRSAEVLATLRAADPDDYRNSVRAAIAAGQDKRLTELAGQQAALEQPAWYAAVLGERMGNRTERGNRLLVTALSRRPGDFGLLMTLGYPLGSGDNGDRFLTPESVAEGEKWLRAAVAARPGNVTALTVLGFVLYTNKDYDGAVAALGEAVRLRPDVAASHSSLGLALLYQKDLDGAIAACRASIRLDPESGYGYHTLGLALLAKKDYEGSVAALRETARRKPLAPLLGNLGMALREQALHAKGDLDASVAVYREAIKIDPKFAPSYEGLGKTLFIKKDVDGAVAAYRESIRLDPKFVHAHQGLGTALIEKNDLVGAEAAFREAIKFDPKNSILHSNLGNVLGRKMDSDGAIVVCREAIKLDPKNATAHANLGIALQNKKDLDAAIAAYREAIRLDPTSTQFNFNFGLALRAKRDVDGAIAVFREVIRLDPKFMPAYFHVGTLLAMKRDLDGASKVLREAIKIDPKFALGHSCLGDVLGEKRDLVGAEAAYREALRLDPKFANAYHGLALVLRDKHDPEGAIAALREAIKNAPTFALAHLALGEILRDKQDLDGAITAWRDAVRFDPKLVPAHHNLGVALSIKKDLDGALAAFGEEIKLDPSNAVSHYNVAFILRDKGEPDKAIAAWREAIRLDPKFPEALCNLGLTLWQQKQFVEAAAMLRKGHEFGSKRPGWPFPSAKWVAECELQMTLKGLIAPMPREKSSELAPAPREGKR